MTSRRGTSPRVGVVGLGYMGLATGLAFAARGVRVHGFDILPKVRSSVARGSTPYYEAGLPELLQQQLRSGRFRVADSLEELVREAEGIFLCVPTPSLRSGRIDLRPLRQASEQVGSALRGTTGRRLVVVKSTVVPGTTEGVVGSIVRRRSGKTPREVGIASNPEFLAEGSMVRDALRPERVVLGTSDRRSLAWLRRVYRPFQVPVFCLTPSGAELVKYASNAFLALKVSFANEASRFADRLGANVDDVMAAVGHDRRIGERFLHAGPGFGGSCFEKDVHALVARADDLGIHFRSGEVALRINREQLDYAFDRVRAAVGPLRGKTLALLGVSFKAGTDDVRESRALPLARKLLSSGAVLRVHDPVALTNFQRAWESLTHGSDERPALCESVGEALEGADAAILHSDWPIYLRWRPAWTRRMKRPLLVDLRRAVDARLASRTGLAVVGLGAGNPGSRTSLRPRRGAR